MFKPLVDALRPKAMTTLQVIGLEDVAGRQHEYVTVYVQDVTDLKRRVRAVAVSTADAYDIISIVDTTGQYPEIEVPSRSVMAVFTFGKREIA